MTPSCSLSSRYGNCANNPDFPGGGHPLNCAYSGKGININPDDVYRLASACPHFVEDFDVYNEKTNPWPVCCE